MHSIPLNAQKGNTLSKRFQHQDEMFQKALGRNAYGFFVEMGLGKTRVAIELALARSQRTLILAPNTVLENWDAEIRKWSNNERKGIILQGSRSQRERLLNLNGQFFIINYEALRILKERLINKGFQFIIADESQKLKGYKTLQSKSAFQIAQAIPYRLIMTGTPITNNPLDLYGQFRFLNPHIFGFSYYRFRAQYAIMGGFQNYQVVKWINMDGLKSIIYKHACSYLKKDCLDLPDKIYEVEMLDLTKEQREKYNELKTQFITEFKGEIVNATVVLTRLIRFQQITSGFLRAGDGTKEGIRDFPFGKNPKLDWVADFLKHRLPREGKVIIFCRFLWEIHALIRLCKETKIGYSVIYGAIKERQAEVDKFNNDPRTRVFIGQLQTSGMGLNLTAASYVVYYSNSYSYGDRIQSEDRAHRIGQCKNVTYIDLVCRKTIDELILKVLSSKKNMADYITGLTPEKIFN
jgi:SNF2 family DNA or RNA helicase